ncbi:MAG: ATP-dependent DNA helicase [Kosmotogaceae bacterium]
MSTNYKDFNSFLEQKGDPPFFVYEENEKSLLKENALFVDELFLQKYIKTDDCDISKYVEKVIELLKKLPSSAVELLDSLYSGSEGTYKLLKMTIENNENYSSWQDSLCWNITTIKSRKNGIKGLDPMKSVRMIFGEGGILQDHLNNYEYRQEQFMTAMEIAETIDHGRGLLLEAGTGTGKTLAYLVPVAYNSLSKNKKAIISTRTRTLQDQLINNDVRILKNLPDLEQLNVTVLKGRERYLCTKKLFEELQLSENMRSKEEKLTFLGVAFWSFLTETGDLDELSIKHSYRDRLITDRFTCLRKFCAFYDKCPYYSARTNAKNSDITITNHSLLFNEAAIRLADGEIEDDDSNGILLPKFDVLVADEAHEIENSITDAMSFNINPYSIAKTTKGSYLITRELLKFLQEKADKEYLHAAYDRAKKLGSAIENNLKTMVVFGDELSPGERKALKNDKLEQFIDILKKTENFLRKLKALLVQLISLLEDTQEEKDEDNPGITGLKLRGQTQLGEIDEILFNLSGFEYAEDTYVHYFQKITKGDSRYLVFSASPVVNESLASHIFPEVSVKIFISATLWVHSKGSDGFNYTRRVLGINEQFPSVKLGTSFDYSKQLRFFVASDMPNYSPRSSEYLGNGAQLVKDILSVTGGGAMVLFTSYNDLNMVASYLNKDLNNLKLHVQEKHDSPSAILEGHMSDNDSVIFGVRTFWEGIDLPGEHLKTLILFKLPFDRPDDPLLDSRIRYYGTKNYVEGLHKYYYPKMITSFRQGLGRLIRTKNDRGCVIVLDKRIVDPKKNYSRKLVNSLPPEMKIEILERKKIITQLRKLKKEKWL